MSLKEKNALKIIFAIDNNYYLIKNIKLKKILNNMRKHYHKYVTNHDVLCLNWFKIKMSFLEELRLSNNHKEQRGVMNILLIMKEVNNNHINDKFYNTVENDISLLNNYL